MKKSSILLLLMSFLVISLWADTQAEINEEMGIDTNSYATVPGVRTTRDIPEGGLLLIPDWTADRVMAFDPITGDLYDADFIPSDETNLSSPKEAALHPDGNSILVSDQIEDGLIQYDLNGNFMGWFAPTGGVNNNILDNVRGWGLKADGSILVTTASGANADAIAEFDADGNYVSNFIAIGAGGMDGPFCVLYRETQDDYLVTASSSDAVHQYDNAGNYITDLVAGINFPQQITETPSGNLLVAGFSTPSGCYEYSSTGAYVGYYGVLDGLRGAYELGNGNILVTNGTGVYEIDRNNSIISTKMTGTSAHFIRFVEGEGGAVNNPPLGVNVDDATGTVSWSAPAGEPVIYENFDSFSVGDYIAVVGDNWTTWSNAPGGPEDALVSDVQSYSPSNSVEVLENNDLVLIMEDYTTGIYQFDMKMFVPTGYCGYFNLQKTSTPGQEWAFQIYYQTDGTALADAGVAGALTHPFNHDEWLNLKVVVDLDNDWATYYFNEVEMIGYQWTLGTFGTPGLLAFGGVNIFGGANLATTDTPMFYVDDVMISEVVTRDLTGFNVYLDGIPDGSVGIDVFDYTYSDLVAGTSYTAGVSAVYDDGESDIVEVDFVYDPDPILDPPINLAVESNINDDFATFTWEAPGGGGGTLFELIQHDGNPQNGYFQAYDNGYGVVYDLSGYTNVTVEMVDFRHSSWGTYGTWDYSIHIVDWDTHTEITEVTDLLTTGDDIWELEIDLGSVLASGLVGIFMEPMGNSAADAYPCIDSDDVGPDGLSYFGPLSNYAGMALSEIGDFLMDLWIMGEETDGVVKAPRFKANFGNGNARIENSIPDVDFVTLNQTATTRDLLGYNVYLDEVQAGNTSDLFWEFTGLVNGVEYSAGVEAVYDDGVSDLVEITFLYEGTIAGDVIVATTQLNNNYPNPFNPVTNISYSIIETGNVTLEVYNLRGQLVKTLVNDVKESGDYTASWNGTDNSNKSVSSGVYFYKMKSSNYTATKKMILMK